MQVRVGAAVARVALAQQVRQQETGQTELAMDETLQQAALEAIDAEGLSIEDYNRVLTLAGSDMDLQQCLLAAAGLPQ